MEKFKTAFEKVRRFVPAVAFVGGFGWDSFTLGRLVQTSDLAILGLYYAVALVFLLLLSATAEDTTTINAEETSSRNKLAAKISKARRFALSRNFTDKWKFRFSYVVQFCFGSLFSALVVCYFKSSGSIAALVLVAMLAALLVLNEFLQKSYERFELSLAFASLIGTMFLNFLIPHLVSSIGFIWFLLSVLISFGICLLAWRLSHRTKKALILPGLISIALLVARILNWIPPVPLVLKEQNACVNFHKNYSCEISEPSFLERNALKAETVHLRPDDQAVYFVSSVFAPASVAAKLEHRWYYKNPNTGKYELVNKISSDRMRTRGSRSEGFRIYTKKRNVPFGKWKVETAVEGGAVIGSKTFLVEEANENSPERVQWKMK